MPGKNLTGKPNTNDYNLGRGIIFLAFLDPNGIPLGYRDVGNAPEFALGVETETLEHSSSRSGLKFVDKEVTLNVGVNVSFSLDEINDENLAAFFTGDQNSPTNGSVAGFSEYVMVADGTLEKGRWYDIKNSSGVRCYDIGTLTVKDNQGSPVTLVLGTDYEVDLEFGRIFTLSTSTALDTAIGLGKGLKVTLGAKAGAKGIDEVRALKKTSYPVALKFIAENPANNGKKTEIQVHRINLKADGDLALIGDDWTTMGFTAKAERNPAPDANSPTLSIRTVKAA